MYMIYLNIAIILAIASLSAESLLYPSVKPRHTLCYPSHLPLHTSPLMKSNFISYAKLIKSSYSLFAANLIHSNEINQISRNIPNKSNETQVSSRRIAYEVYIDRLISRIQKAPQTMRGAPSSQLQNLHRYILSSKSVDEAYSLYTYYNASDEYGNKHCKTNNTLCILFTAFDNHRNFSLVDLVLHNDRVASTGHPNRYTWKYLISLIASRGDWILARKILNRQLRYCSPKSKVYPDFVSYINVLRCMAKNEVWNQIIPFYNTFKASIAYEKASLKSKIDFFEMLLSYTQKQSNWKAATWFLEDMKNQSITPSRSCYRRVAIACTKSSMLELGMKYTDELIEKHPNESLNLSIDEQLKT